MYKIKHIHNSKAFTVLELLMVVFLTLLLYSSFSSNNLNFQNKQVTIRVSNLCSQLKTYDKGQGMKLLITKDKKNNIVYTINGKRVTLKLNIDFDNFYILDQSNHIKTKVFEDNIVFEYNINKKGYCQKYLYLKDDNYYIQSPFKSNPEIYEKIDIK
jgi:competence protein ComGC